jgi:hypothetical protein
MKEKEVKVPDTSQDYESCIGQKETKDKPGSLADFLGIADTPESEEDAWKEHNYMNWREHYVGMPTFESENLEAKKQLIINFRTEEEFLAFSNLIDQKLTLKTRSVWYPGRERNDNLLKRWLDEGDA